MTGAWLVFYALALSQAAQAPTCTTAEDCREQTRAAIAAEQFELAHDLAWLAYQKGSRTDAETLMLLARAQSLSGRGDDAFVMLRRLAEAGVAVADLATSDDFERVRRHAQWPQLLATFEQLNTAGDSPVPASPPADAKRTSEDPKRSAPAVAAPAVTTPAAPPPPADPPPAPPASAADAPAKASAPPPAITSVDAVRAGEDLTLPGLSFAPAALAYDAVSARFILSTAASDALTVLSQTSTNATAFTSRGWSGRDRTTAIAIDRVAGDLWVAVHGAEGAALHRLQLISGRRLDAVEVPNTEPAELTALALSRGGLLVLDRAGRRVLRKTAASPTLDSYVTLPKDIEPSAMTQGANALYVAHPEGIFRVDLSSRRLRPITAGTGMAVAGLESLAWHDGVLIGIQQNDGGRRVIRLTLNPAGSSITRIDALGAASSQASTIVAGVFYYLTDDDGGRRVIRAISVK